jgi:glycosyltransferase involved in cell wall biosynthesis
MRCETNLKIVYIVNARIPSEKAHPYQILKMCEAFVKNGMDVELVVPFRVQTSKQMRAIKDVWRYYGIEEKFKITTLPSFDLIFVGSHLPNWIEYFFFYLQASTFYVFAMLYSLLRKGEIIYSRDPQFPLVLSLIKPSWWPRMYYEAHTFPGSRVGKRLRSWVGRRIGGLIVITNALKELYVELGVPEDRVLVAPDGVDLTKFCISITRDQARCAVGFPLDKKIVGYVGRFHTMEMTKGLDTMIKALRILKEEDLDDVALCFVGGPLEMAPLYLDLAKKEGIEEKDLMFVNHVPPGRIPLYLRSFDICTMPFPWTEHFAYYASPLKLFEYMASKTPIVATDLPSTREVLRDGENAILIEPDKPKALAGGIERALSDAELAARIGRQAREDVGQYTWEKRAVNITTFATAQR